MKRALDEKVTPDQYKVGGAVLLNDPMENVGVPGKVTQASDRSFYHHMIKFSLLPVDKPRNG